MKVLTNILFETSISISGIIGGKGDNPTPQEWKKEKKEKQEENGKRKKLVTKR